MNNFNFKNIITPITSITPVISIITVIETLAENIFFKIS